MAKIKIKYEAKFLFVNFPLVLFDQYRPYSSYIWKCSWRDFIESKEFVESAPRIRIRFLDSPESIEFTQTHFRFETFFSYIKWRIIKPYTCRLIIYVKELLGVPNCWNEET